jgi:hypothetical protein
VSDAPASQAAPFAQVADATNESGADVPSLPFVLVFLMITSLALPVLVSMSSPIGALIIGFGMFQAWTMNRRPKIDVAGPFSLGTDLPPPIEPK